jgi:hypothetical protein
VMRVEEGNAVVLASAHENAERFACEIALLKDELAAEHLAREVSENNSRNSPIFRPKASPI